ncbi:hypothetical protein CFC21_045123 [Triticum aestivum]|uniref:Ubiquitin-like domain-containing protein n=3 Tax=Triticum TaxID=4564 RepID=A0A9R1R0J1_TRITD|nr:hypothetical protein CFC21_045123 [Triticum aestivum]VAH86596.1 unnamed protein product [Triticum turgidum subsp. durum]
MDVTFEAKNGSFTLEVWYFATVKQMKEMIHKRYRHLPVKAQRLFFNGKELDDDRNTEHYGIIQGSSIRLELLASLTMLPL